MVSDVVPKPLVSEGLTGQIMLGHLEIVVQTKYMTNLKQIAYLKVAMYGCKLFGGNFEHAMDLQK